MSARRWLPLILGIVMQSSSIGCNSSTLAVPSTVDVSGSVICNGKLTPGVRVKFHPQFDIGKVEFIPYGDTGLDGKFTLSTGVSGNGAPPGEYVVTLEMPYVDIDPKDGLETERDLLKGTYSNPDRSKLSVTLESGDNVLDPFTIKLP